MWVSVLGVPGTLGRDHDLDLSKHRSEPKRKPHNSL